MHLDLHNLNIYYLCARMAPGKSDEILKQILHAVTFNEESKLGLSLTNFHEDINGLRADIQSLTAAIKDLKQNCEQRSTPSETTDSGELCSELRNLTTSIQDLKTSVVLNQNMCSPSGVEEYDDEDEDDDDGNVHQKALNCRNKFISTWRQKANQRKQHLYQQMRNKTINTIYMDWCQDGDFVPKKYKPKPITGEPEDQKKIRTDLAKMKMKAEAELCSLKAQKHWERVQTIDIEMFEVIESNADGEVKEHLKEMYRQECEKIEVNARSGANKHESWLMNLPNSENDDPSSKAETQKRAPLRTRISNRRNATQSPLLINRKER